MPVTFDNVASTSDNTNALSLTLTVTSGAVLLAFIANRFPAEHVSAVAYNGVAMTQLGMVSTTSQLAECWGLTSPAAGTHVLSAQFTEFAKWTMVGVSYANVKAVGPFGTVASASVGNATNANLSISSTATDLAVGFFVANNQAITPANGTSRFNGNNTASGAPVVVADIAGASNAVTLSANVGGANQWAMLGLNLRFSVAAVTSPRTLCLTGVGR